MKNTRYFQYYILIFTTLMIAWLLMLFPIAEDWQWLRPQWLFLVIIYWLLTRPEIIGISGAWIAGLVMDILSGGLLGKYALGALVVAYLARSLRYRLRVYPIWQQSMAILLMVGVGNIVLFLVEWLTGHPPHTGLYWLPTLSSVLVWPWFYRLLQFYERKFSR